MARILLVEDEIQLSDIVRAGLKEEHHSVDVAYDGEEAVWAIEGGEHELILLDIMLPKMSGLEVCKRVREQGITTPILMLTARDHTDDIVQGLDLGANDYLTKPFAFDELLARIRALLRIRSANVSSEVNVGPLKVALSKKQVECGGATLDLTNKEFQVLEQLVRNAGSVVSKQSLFEALWEHDSSPDSNQNAIEVYVSSIRRKLGEELGHTLLRTKRGVGYILSWEEKA